jgi:hypothetical protein
MLSGKSGRPDVCVARCTRRIGAPACVGTAAPAGRSALTGVSRASAPAATSCARTRPVIGFVPISKMGSAAGTSRPPIAVTP